MNNQGRDKCWFHGCSITYFPWLIYTITITFTVTFVRSVFKNNNDFEMALKINDSICVMYCDLEK